MSASNLGLWLIALFGFMLIAEIIGGYYRRAYSPTKDKLFTLAGLTAQTFVTPPIIGVLVGMGFVHFFPGSAGRYVNASFWLVFPIWFVTEEFLHYWLHRWSHEWRWLWKLHRTHHSATHLNIGVIFRYNVFWTFILPQVWFGAIATYLGLIQVYVVSVLITFIVNLLTHTAYRWDLALRKLPGMDPVFNVVEKVITLPDTHHAHHGMGRGAHMRGNYAVTIFLFDVLLGTAKFPHARQERFGLPGRFDWKEELFWPVMRRRDSAEASE